jgi:recombination protein RecT
MSKETQLAVQTVRNTLEAEKMQAELVKALPRHISPEKLIRVAMTALQKQPKLVQCMQENPLSVYSAVTECAQLGLMPDGILGEAYFVPFFNNKKQRMECQLIAGYKGLITLAMRTDKVSHITAECVYENDEFAFELGSHPTVKHRPLMTGDRGAFVGAYAVANLVNNPTHPMIEWMNAEQIEKIKQASRGKSQAPWREHEDEMRKKTVIRRMCKKLPLSPELMAAASKGEYYEAGVLDGQAVTKSGFGFGARKAPEEVEVEVSDTPEPEGEPTDAEIDAAFPPDPDQY